MVGTITCNENIYIPKVYECFTPRNKNLTTYSTVLAACPREIFIDVPLRPWYKLYFSRPFPPDYT